MENRILGVLLRAAKITPTLGKGHARLMITQPAKRLKVRAAPGDGKVVIGEFSSLRKRMRSLNRS